MNPGTTARILIQALATLLCCLLSPAIGQAETDSIRISLITYAPTPPVDGAFGHSAIRLQNFSKGTDWNYNYGVFDFDTPGFVLKFLRGKLPYRLGRKRFPPELLHYKQDGRRSLKEQPLLLRPEEAAAVEQYLEHNYRPENRYYQYDFFLDNCATRLRDIVENSIEGPYAYKAQQEARLSFRQLLDTHLENRPWDDFGMDLLLGLPADRKASFRQQMFLPLFLSENLGASLMRQAPNGQLQPLVGPTQTLVQGSGYGIRAHWITPFRLFAFLLLCILALTLLWRNHPRRLRILDNALFSLLGGIGVFLLFMWLGTDHQATRWNLNTIWANPLYLPLMLAIGTGWKKGRFWLYGLGIISTLGLILSWPYFPQQFHFGIFPILLVILLRSASGLLRCSRDKGI